MGQSGYTQPNFAFLFPSTSDNALPSLLSLAPWSFFILAGIFTGYHLWMLEMMVNGCTVTSGTMNMNPRISSFVQRSPPRPSPSSLFPRAAFPCSGLSRGPDCKLKLSSSRKNLSMIFSAASNSPLSRNLNGSSFIPWLPPRKRKMTPPRASKDVPLSFRFPPMTKKPKFWWRILACIPYLMPLHETWMYAETAYNLHPFLEDFERVTYPFLGFIGSLPSWFLMAYFFVGYLFIVRRKEWPHFFRFHVILGMLLEIFLQVLGTASRWMPKSYYYGKIGMHFWVTVAFAHLFTVLECIRCAICGMYADVPFASDAAYIQMPYD